MVGFLLRAAITALGLWVASELLSGLSFDSTTKLIIAAVVLGVVNAFVRPLAIILTVLGFNLLGDALRDALDPRLSQTRR